MRSIRLVGVVAWLAVGVAAWGGCGDAQEEVGQRALDAGEDGTDAGTDAPDADAGDDSQDADAGDEPEVESEPRALHDLAATGVPEGFFDHPWPSELRLTAQGAPELSALYTTKHVALLDLIRADIARDVRGFSPLSAAYFRFSSPLDEAALALEPAETLAEGSPVYLVVVDPASPHLGERTPVEVHWRAQEGRFWRPNTLALVPPQGWPMRPGTLYAAVVERGLEDAEGREVLPAREFEALLGERAPEGREAAWENLRPLVEWMGEGEARGVLSAAVFRTSDPAAEMVRFRAWLHARREAPVVTAGSWRRTGDHAEDGYYVYEGKYNALELFSGEVPYLRPGEGVIQIEEDGAPKTPTEVELRFIMTVPAGEPPEGGWPLAVYSHGSGGSARGVVDPEGIDAAGEGLAMIAIDQPLQGARKGEVSDFVQHLLSLAVQNPASGRDLYRHAVPDLMQLARLVGSEGFVVPAEVSHTGGALRFKTERMPFVGHSQGSQAGGLLLGLEPAFGSGFLSEGGGGVATAFLLRKANDADIERLVALLLGIDLGTEPMGPYHPAVSLLVQPLFDAADPLHSARLAIRDPLEGQRPVHIFMTQGTEDEQTVPATIKALASVYGLPIAKPAPDPSPMHELWGIESEALPLQGNVTLGPEPVTGVLVQFPGYGHYPLYEDPQAKVWYKAWLKSAVEGAPLVPARAE